MTDQEKVREIERKIAERWPDCGEVQCKQVHNLLDSLMEFLGMDKDLNLYAVHKMTRIIEALKEKGFDVSNLLYVRCTKHIQVPQQNCNDFKGGECGACIASERDRWKILAEAYKAGVDSMLDEIEILKTKIRYLTEAANQPHNTGAKTCKTLAAEKCGI